MIILTLCINSAASAQSPFQGEGNPQRDITWLYESPLIVTEEITLLSGGNYEYKFSFENIDQKHIWHFGVYTTFSITSSSHTWEQRDGTWDTIFLNSLNEIDPDVYDARNINPDITSICGTHGGAPPDVVAPIVPDEFVNGFTFESNTYDDSSKLYYYETVEDGWASNTGYVAAIGYTQAGTVATESATFGGIKSLYR